MFSRPRDLVLETVLENRIYEAVMTPRSTKTKAALVNLTTYGLLIGAAVLSFRMPRQLTVKWAYAESEYAIANFVGDQDRVATADGREARDETIDLLVAQRDEAPNGTTLGSP